VAVVQEAVFRMAVVLGGNCPRWQLSYCRWQLSGWEFSWVAVVRVVVVRVEVSGW